MPEIGRKPRIALGSDHAGFHIKETFRPFLENSGYPVARVQAFLNTPFLGGRHARRLEKIALIEMGKRGKNKLQGRQAA